MLETYVSKNWYCVEFNLTGSDLGFTTRFWISITELFVTMNSFTITERNKNQWIYQWICDIQIVLKLSYISLLRIIIFDYFTYDSQSTQIILKNVIHEFPKSMMKAPSLQKGPIKWVLFICPSVCPSVCDAFSSVSTQWIFKFFCMRIFSHIY